MRQLRMVFFSILLLTALSACTEKERVRTFGGTLTVELPPGQKLTVATWKDRNLWYLTRPMRPGESPETYTFTEDSNYGFMEGVVVFQEKEPASK